MELVGSNRCHCDFNSEKKQPTHFNNNYSDISVKSNNTNNLIYYEVEALFPPPASV